MEKIKIILNSIEYENDVLELARKVKTEIVKESDISKEDIVLNVNESGISLQSGNLVLMGDFEKLIPRVKKISSNTELIVKASKIKGKTTGLKAIDATAGLGEDSLILAAAGFNVELYEYDPVIALLLKDTVRRAGLNPFYKDIVSRMVIHNEDSIEAMNNCTEDMDVVLLDPMFPERNKSAMIGKKFQLLQRLESPCTNELQLLEAANKVRPRKLIIKRPVKGAFLGGVKPEYTISGKAVRYDCFTFAR